MSSKRFPIGAALLAIVAVAQSVLAQQAAPSAPGNAIEERTRQQLRLPGREEREEALLTGDTDIVLTRPTRLFTLHGDVDTALTDNAFLTRADRVSDVYFQAQAGIGVGTRIGGLVDLFANVSVISVRYQDEDELDYGAIDGIVGAGLPVGRLRLSATYQPVIVFERDFEDRQLTTHRMRLSASLPLIIGPLLAQPFAFFERTEADPDDYAAWSGGGGLALTLPLSQRLPIVAFGNIEYERRDYDDYFPDLVGVDREDDMISAGLGLAWRPREWGELRLGWDFLHNSSTSDVNRFQANTGHLGIAARLRF